MAKERPILFSGPMVRAILDGRKTQTRRVCKDLMAHPPPQCQPSCNVRYNPPSKQWQRYGGGGVWIELRCPYGVPGDTLWVRETWQAEHDVWNAEKGGCVHSYRLRYAADKTVKTWPCNVDTDYKVLSPRLVANCKGDESSAIRRHPSIHMPRWASRITLEVTDVRVERVQEISEQDSVREGIEPPILPKNDVRQWWDYEQKMFTTFTRQGCAQDSFRTLWNSINAKRGFGWEANPWIWAITFKRVRDDG